GGYGWVVVAAASLVFFITFGYMNSYGVFQRLYTEEVFKDDATPATVSLIGSITTIISNCIGSPSGYLVDRIGIRTTVQIGAAIMSAGFVLASFSRQIWQLYITQGVIVGFGLCLAGFPCVAVPSYWFSRRRGLATGIVFAGSGLGGLALAPITQALINSVGVYWTLRVLALLVAVLAGTSSLFLRQYSSHRGRQKKMYDFTKLRDIRFIYLLLASIFSSVAYFIPFMFIPIQATRLGYSTSSASALVSVINAGSVGGRVFGGVFADCVGSINALITSTIVQVLSLAVMWLPFHNSLPAFFAFAVAYGVSCGGYASILPVVIADIWGLNGLTGTVGLAYIGYAIGSGSGPP
ncbi:MFS general substrate transporter, partial [Ramicandelaber brevisporus]